MIRINLIPVEVVKKAQQQRLILLAGLTGSVVILIAIIVFLLRIGVEKSLQAQLIKLEKEIQEYKKVAEDVKKLRDIEKTLSEKKKVIEELKKGTLLYPKFVEEFMVLIPESVWFNSFTTKTTPEGLSISISCNSLSNFAIADFISNLEQAAKFSKIEIDAINVGTGPDGKEIYSFNLKCNYQA